MSRVFLRRVRALLSLPMIAMITVACGADPGGDLFPSDDGGDPPAPDASAGDDDGDDDDDAMTPDAAGPVASFSSDGLDFGLADCAGAAPPDDSITLTNRGGAALTWEASLSASQTFSIHGAKSGSIAPGKSASIVIRVASIPSAATAGDPQQGLLSVTTNDPKHATTALALQVTPAGGMLSMTTTDVSFGQVGLNAQATDIPISLTNAGNRSVGVTIGASSDPSFALAWQGAPAKVTLAPGESVADLVARFKPAKAIALTATASVTVDGVVCGPSTASLALSGEGTNGTALVSPGSLSFGSIRCGKKASPQTIVVSNGGNRAFKFTAALGLGASSPYAVSPTTATVAPDADVTITVTPASIPASSATTSDLYADKVTITTDVVGDTAHVVKLHETALGARLAFSRSTIPFGDVPSHTQASTSFTVKNNGNAAATVTLMSSGAPFGVSPAQASPVAENGGSLAASASYAPTATGQLNGTLWITTHDGLCASLPAAMTLTGNGTSGKVSLSTQSLDFGEVPCGTTAGSQTIHLKNIGTASFTWTGVLAKTASPYAVDIKSGTLAAGQEVVITATPKAIPQTSATTAGLYNDVFTITTNVAGDTPHAVKLVESALGAILTYPTAHSFGPIATGTASAPWSFSFTNAGNQAATVSLAPSNGSAFAFGSNSVSVGATAQAGDSATYTSPATAPPTTTESVPVSVVAGTPLCAPLPGPIVLTATSAASSP